MTTESLLERPAGQRADYRYSFTPYPHRVRAEFAGVTVADSERAMVMHETRLAPVVYFPREDVRMDLMTRTGTRTHCPFKGNASYWTLEVGGRRAENVVWAYESPLPEAAELAGYVAFYADRLDGWYEDDRPREPVPAGAAGEYANPLLGWLLRDAPGIGDSRQLTAALAERMVAAGMPLWRLTVIIRTLHPQIVGMAWRWWRPKLQIDELPLARERLTSPQYLNSPLVSIFEGAGGIRRRLDVPDPVLDFGILEDLHAEGATDYVAMPMTFSDGQINAVTLASDRPGGFSTADLGHLYEVLPLLGRVYEVHAMRRTAITLLDTYLGRHAGQRVLDGQIERGAGESIRAVIWFCDLRDSTVLARALPRADFLAALDAYFDSMAGAVLDHGGEVLRFIGDAALAIFPVEAFPGGPDEQADAACAAAAAAAEDAGRRMAARNEDRAREGLCALDYGIALHLGEVTYGNIGTGNRLEFTVVGDAANVAARVEAQCKELGERILLTDEVAGRLPGRARALGTRSLRGVDAPLALHALATAPAEEPS